LLMMHRVFVESLHRRVVTHEHVRRRRRADEQRHATTRRARTRTFVFFASDAFSTRLARRADV